MMGVFAAVLIGGCIAMVANSPGPYAPPAGVSHTDAEFLKAVRGHGITNDRGDMALIDLAHKTCGELAGGQSVDGIAEHWGLTSERMSADSARFFVRTAAAAYCPEYL